MHSYPIYFWDVPKFFQVYLFTGDGSHRSSFSKYLDRPNFPAGQPNFTILRRYFP
jgi:hypothetical protein